MPITAHVVSFLKVTHTSFSVVESSREFSGLKRQKTLTLPPEPSGFLIAEGAMMLGVVFIGVISEVVAGD
mgnify:CR=1 FL=1